MCGKREEGGNWIKERTMNKQHSTVRNVLHHESEGSVCKQERQCMCVCTHPEGLGVRVAQEDFR